MNHLFTKMTAGLVLATSASLAHAEFAGNISISNNYIWRGLTQVQDQPAVSGGLDWSHESGFYIGTWVSNVEYAANDAFSYEHDIYAGYAWSWNDLSFDVGYLYYNYNEEADFDFGEVYGSVGYKGFSVTAYVFTHTQDEESNGIAVKGSPYEYDFGDTYYISVDYGFALPNLEGWEMSLHGGYHDGDFVDGFNFAGGNLGTGIFNYFDYNVALSKAGFTFMVSGTDLDQDEAGGPAGSSLNNDDLKYVLSYSLDF